MKLHHGPDNSGPDFSFKVEVKLNLIMPCGGMTCDSSIVPKVSLGYRRVAV